MIHKLEKLKDDWYLINDSVRIKYIEVNDDIEMKLEIDETLITEEEAIELGNELFIKIVEYHEEK